LGRVIRSLAEMALHETRIILEESQMYRIIIEIEKKGGGCEDFEETIKIEKKNIHELESIVGDAIEEFFKRVIARYREKINSEAEKVRKGK